MRLSIAIGLTLVACSPRQHGNDVDIGNAARAAQISSDSYAGDERGSSPAIVKPLATVAPPPAPSPDATAQTPDPSTGAQGAASVVKSYFALIEQKQYSRARQLWDREGGASGMTPAAFAASFAKYAEFHAEVGAPGRVDSGAGQRYVTVPVEVSGVLATGKPFVMKGPLTLHRAGDIDGATQEQREWRITESALKPRPATDS